MRNFFYRSTLAQRLPAPRQTTAKWLAENKRIPPRDRQGPNHSRMVLEVIRTAQSATQRFRLRTRFMFSQVFLQK